ncbi:hypothetical protein NDU88_010786 [Pleurodeles waltl]|uniref:Uncharacterized protein n=1 Tax=Pleurodeles waltl TaxID=8319 RepID=A0AAV7S280_PLEWA|nr:hypothetical protein NDU88_010786 [Pleurodeles waltl]
MSQYHSAQFIEVTYELREGIDAGKKGVSRAGQPRPKGPCPLCRRASSEKGGSARERPARGTDLAFRSGPRGAAAPTRVIARPL